MNRLLKQLMTRSLFLTVASCLILTMTVTAAGPPEADRTTKLEERIAVLEKLVIEFADELALLNVKLLALEDKLGGKSETPSSAMTVIFKGIKFFESGFTAPEIANRVFNFQFSKNTTRYVFYQVSLENKLWKIRDNPVKVQARYYYPDGRLMGEPVLEYTVPSDWDIAELHHGWGWNDPGNWPQGKYRVELFIGGNKIAMDYFTIN
ncbi:MAG: hypothetical protein AB1427_01200 [Thermodesulfobacteriota bacterium]